MKKRFVYILIALALFLCACASERENFVDDYDEEIIHVEAHYEGLLEEYRSEVEKYREELAYYEEVIWYYENLCDYYGYQTYEGVYYPELWCNYIPKNGKVYHNDWLCPNFDNSGNYLVTANPEYYEEYENYTQCETCGNTQICFLDVDEGIIHSQKRHLDLGTDDFISCDVVYRFVSSERAIENGFKYCDSCDFE